MFAAFLTTFLFSISAVSAQRAAKALGGLEANFWRLICATGFLALGAHLFGGGLKGTALPVFLLSGCIGFGVGDMAFYQALPRIGSRLSVLLLLCLSAPLAAVIEWLWLGTALSTAEIVAGITILAGVALALSPEQHRGQAVPDAASHFTSGIIFGLIASACQGYGAVLSRKAFAVASHAGENIDGITAAYQRILGGLAVSLLGVLIIKNRPLAKALYNWQTGRTWVSPERKARWAKVWPWVVLNALAGGALGVSCFQWALKTTPTGIVLPIVAITPIVIIPFSRYFEGERPTRRSLIGGFIAVCGAVALAAIKA